jgi:hypothetical protein
VWLVGGAAGEVWQNLLSPAFTALLGIHLQSLFKLHPVGFGDCHVA